MSKLVDIRRGQAGANDRLGLPPYPTGWFALAFSDEVKPGQVIHGTYFGQELVIYRGKQSRRVSVFDAHCPHMGAHMGHGGTVEGDELRCPFHGFCFDHEGACRSTPYPTRRPIKARMKSWPVVEINGAIFAWWDEAGREPLWELPTVDFGGFQPLRTKVWPKLASHPQETTENSVDFGHLAVVHKYEDVEILKPLQLDGPYLTAQYGMTRRHPLMPNAAVRSSFEIHVHGLGYSYVHVLVPQQGLEAHKFVFPTPVDGKVIQLRAASSVKVTDPSKVAKPLALMPRAAALRIIEEAALRAYCSDIEQDFDIWENKRYLQPASLAEGDGPVGPYRKWCKQFYPQGPAAPVEVLASRL